MSTSITSSTLGKRTYKIIFLGDTGTGKTSIIQRFVSNKFEDKQNPTIGIDFLGKNLNYKGTTCRLQLWDTAGQQRFKSLIPTYLKDAVCAVFVFDVNNPNTLSNLQDWIQMFRQNKGDKTVSVICGNKSDLEKTFNKNQLEKIMTKHKLPYHTVSAKTSENIEELFYAILDLINQLNLSKNKKFQKALQQEVNNAPLTVQPLKPHTIQTQQQMTKDKNKVKLQTQEGKKKKKFFCC